MNNWLDNKQIINMKKIIFMTICMFFITSTFNSQSILPQFILTTSNAVDSTSEAQFVIDGVMNEIYNDTIFEEGLNCRNGNLKIINNSYARQLSFQYNNLGTLDKTNTNIRVTPNTQPLPTISYDQTTLNMSFNCPTDITNDNYYNKIQLYLPTQIKISFLLDCDPTHRHKKFQYGYLIISLINAAITFGVAFKSSIHSIQWKSKKIAFQLNWIMFAIFTAIAIVLIAGLYIFAFNDFMLAFQFVRYAGIVISIPFVFICFNQLLYNFKIMRQEVYRKVRYCDMASIGIALTAMITCIFVENWILYDMVAICICVGSIKLFYFNNLKQAYISMSIYTVTVTVIAIISHGILERSYNDYAYELSSPLFIQVPDLVSNLFKKCSWLPVIDITVPGVALSYLRMHDENKSSRYGGVYTVSGNITFILSTALWIGLQVLYPFSIPFCLVTYLSLMAVVVLIAWSRNDLKTLMEGTFVKYSSIHSDLEEKRESFSKLIGEDMINPLKQTLSKDQQDDD